MSTPVGFPMTGDDDFLLLRLAEVAREVVLHLIYRDLLHLTPLPDLWAPHP